MENKNKQKVSGGSKEGENLPMIEVQETEPTEVLLERAKDEAIELAKGKLDLKKGGNIVIGTINVMARPLAKHLKNRHEKFYRESKFHLVADIVFVLLILGLAAAFFRFYTFQPKAQIDLETTVASDSVVSGQSETYVIQYKNNGKVDIKSATLSLVFPKNFVLQTASPQNSWSDQTNTFTLGDLPRGANGKVKITGVALGAVGSGQTLSYSLNYSDNGQAANTLGSYLFTLESSVLSVSFDAPKQIYQNLDFSGNINLKNTGTADIAGEIDLAFVGNPITIKSVSADGVNLVNGVPSDRPHINICQSGIRPRRNECDIVAQVSNLLYRRLPAG